MIKNKYYLYSHRLLTSMDIFYIGIGTKKYGERDYCRAFAFSKKARNNDWHKIFKANKRNILVSIEEEFNALDKCREAEKRWINKYGRKDNGTGVLCNMTNGGMSATYPARKINQYSLNGEFIKTWDNVKEISNFYNISEMGIYSNLDKENSRASGYIWRVYFDNFPIKINAYCHSKSYPIYQYDKELNLVNMFKSASEACLKTGVKKANLLHCINKTSKQRKTAIGFIWTKEAKEKGYSLNRLTDE